MYIEIQIRKGNKEFHIFIQKINHTLIIGAWRGKSERSLDGNAKYIVEFWG